MASLKEVKNRIASVNSTRKITSAMKMVASSKLHHAQQSIERMLPYEETLERMLKTFLATQPDLSTSFEHSRQSLHTVALVVYASNSSLCGGFNGNVIKEMTKAVNHYRELGVERIVIYPIGRKIAEKVNKMGLESAGDFTHLADKPNEAECREVSISIIKKFVAGEYDHVDLIYHHFKSAGSQILRRKQYLPIDLSTQLSEVKHDRDLQNNVATAESIAYAKAKGEDIIRYAENRAKPLNDNYIIEPSLPSLLEKLIPKELHLMLYTALLDSNASEHAARMIAMQTATDNADELLRQLRLQYNKTRQYAITAELLDIVGGSMQ